MWDSWIQSTFSGWLSRKERRRMLTFKGAGLWRPLEADKVLENFVSAEPRPAWNDRDRQTKWLPGQGCGARYHRRQTCHPGRPQGQSIKPQRVVLSLNLVELSWRSQELSLDQSPPQLSTPTLVLSINPFWMEMAILCCPTIVLWKQITWVLCSQVHRWRGILSQDRWCPESHPYLI